MTQMANTRTTIIPVVAEKPAPLPWPAGVAADAATPALRDQLGRPLRDLRISVTDKCNFRCSYCMPKSVFDRDHVYLAQNELLSFEEITTVAQAATQLGVKKLRITGGEPLLRKHLHLLIAQLSTLRTTDGQPLDLTLTTNASLLARQARALKDAGLNRLTISLDALDDAVFRRMNDMDFPVADVLAGIAAAQAVGFGNIKVNMVVKRGTNEDQIVPMAQHFRGTGVALRFIEYMDVGASNGWRMDEVLPSADVLALLQAQWPMQALPANSSGETAKRYGYLNDSGALDASLGEVGFISSVTQAFCHECNRARLSTDGKLFNCLFANAGFDVKALLRQAAGADTSAKSATPAPTLAPAAPAAPTATAMTATALAQRLGGAWAARRDQYSALRQAGVLPAGNAEQRIEMSYIGG
jgi:GTP 3',8-cyclase